MSPKVEIPANIQNEFGQAHSSGDGLTFQAGVNTGTINIDREFFAENSTMMYGRPIIYHYRETQEDCMAQSRL